jgi:ubiquinone/menaquinone biosynthesis C-methylase UbiE
VTVKRIPLVTEPIAGVNEVDGYDRYAGLYMVPEYKYFARRILKNGIKGGRVLDIGSGSGRLAIELAKAGGNTFEIIGLDSSREMLEKARRNARQAGVGERVRFIQATASALPFRDGSFDAVISYASLHHWLDPVGIFNEAHRVVKAGGTILIRDNRRVFGSLWWDAFFWVFTRFMTKPQRRNWSKAILASYTLSEVTALIKESRLDGCRIGTDFVKFDLFIECPGRF